MASGRAFHALHPSFGSRLARGCMYVFLILFALSILYPFWVTLITSFSTVDEVTTLGFKLWISEWSTGAYRFAFSTYGNAGIAYYNSIYRTVLGTSVAVAMTLLAAYPLAKRNLPGRNVLTIVLLITLFFAGGLVPNYLLIRRLGLIDTRWALILPLAVNGFYIIIARNFLMTIDPAYEDAALVDGAGYPEILARIIVPLSKPIIATLALWTAVAHWNAWFDALIYIRSERKIVLQTLLRRMIQQIQEALLGVDRFRAIEDLPALPTEAVQAALIILTIGPIVLAYPFLQKYFIKGIFIGSLKG